MQTLNLETLRRLPAFAALMEEAERKSLDERAALIEAWQTTNTQARAEVASLEATERKLSAEADALAAELQRLTEQRDLARMGLLRVANRHHRHNEEARQRIIAGADSRLFQFILWARRAANMAAFASHRAEPLAVVGDFTAQTLKATKQARLVAELCEHAAERAEAMRLEAISSSDVTGELSAMAANIRDAYQPLAMFVGALPAEPDGLTH